MANKDYELLKQYKQLNEEFEIAKNNYLVACDKGKHRLTNVQRFDAAHKPGFKRADQKELSGMNSKGLIAATILTGGLSAGLLANRIKKEKQTEEWNDNWEERYYKKYEAEIRECARKDAEQRKKDNVLVKEAFDKMNAVKAELHRVTNAIMLPESLKKPNRIDDLLRYFESGKAKTLEEAMVLYEPVLKRVEEEQRIAEEKAERERRKKFEEEMLKNQEEQKKLLEEVASRNSSLEWENSQLRNQISSLNWKIDELSSRSDY